LRDSFFATFDTFLKLNSYFLDAKLNQHTDYYWLITFPVTPESGSPREKREHKIVTSPILNAHGDLWSINLNLHH